MPVDVPVEKLQQSTVPGSQPIQQSLQFCQQTSFEVPQPMYAVYGQYQQPVPQSTFEAQPAVAVYNQPETAPYVPQQPVVQYQQVPLAQPTFEPKPTVPVYSQPESTPASYIQQQSIPVQYQQVPVVQATFEPQAQSTAVPGYSQQQPDMTSYVQQQQAPIAQPVAYQPALQPTFESQSTLPVYPKPDVTTYVQQQQQPVIQYQQQIQPIQTQPALPVYTSNPQDVVTYGQQQPLSHQPVVGYVPQSVDQQQILNCPTTDPALFPVLQQQPSSQVQSQTQLPQYVQQVVYSHAEGLVAPTPSVVTIQPQVGLEQTAVYHHPGAPEPVAYVQLPVVEQLPPQQQPQSYSVPTDHHHGLHGNEVELSVLHNPLLQAVQHATTDFRATTPEPNYHCNGSDVYTTDSCGESSAAETLDSISASTAASVLAAASSTVTSTALEKRQARRTANTKRRRTVERGPRLTVISVNGTVIEFQLEAMKQKTVTTFKFDQTDTTPADVAKNLIQAGLLSEEHAEIVIEQV